MARKAAVKVVNNFSKGLITEATGFNFPEDAATDALNVVFTDNGEVEKRKGFNYEDNFQFFSTSTDSKSIKEFLWENASGNVQFNFVVVQVGAILHFYLLGDSTAISGQKKSFTVDLNTYKVAGSPAIEEIEVSFAVGLNYLFVAHPFIESIYIKYEPETDSLTTVPITLYIRDFEGVNDSLVIDQRPTTLSTLHKYNLNNQGWYTKVITGSSNSVDPITSYFSSLAEYPSNSEIWWILKNASDQFNPVLRNSTARGNTPAPKGHYIIKALYQDRSSVSAIPGISVITSSYLRPSVITFFAGRAWYAGVNYRNFTNKVYFSQVIERDEQINLCHQVNDPTSDDNADLLPTDGGVIVIPDMGTVYRMINIQSSLLIFTSTGIWAISGSQGLGFTANDYSIRKISSVQSISSSNFADIEGFAIWWNLDGIYTVTTDNLGNFQVSSITDETIKDFIQGIPPISKRYVKGSYNKQSKIIQWIYRSEEEQGIVDRYAYDSILCLNTISNAFYPWRVTTNNRLMGVISTQGAGSQVVDAIVLDGDGAIVVDNADANITVEEVQTTPRSAIFKYLTYNANGITFSEEYDTNYLDWNLVDYEAYLETGYGVDGQGVNFVQTNYVYLFMKEQEDASCKVQGKFDWATTSSSGKWSVKQEAYNSTPFRSTRVRRLKIRGKGRCVQLRFIGVTGKPFKLEGWSLFESGNSGP